VRCTVLDDPADPANLAPLLDTDNLVIGGQNMIDPANGDFNLDTAGSGVDLCDFSVLKSETVLDAANHQRPQDIGGVDNGGFVDVGAFEADGTPVPFIDVEPLLDITIPDMDGDPLFEEVDAGTSVTVEIRLTNNGLSAAPINTGFQYIVRGVDPDSVNVNAGIEFGCSTQSFADYALEINCNNILGVILAGGTTGPVTVTATADGTPGISFSYLQTVDVTFPAADDAVTSNNLLVGTLVVTGSEPTADLSVSKEDLVDPVNHGEVISYVLTVMNNGPAIATDVSVVDDLPEEVTFLSESSIGFDCEHESGTVLCTIASMPPGSNRTIQINAYAPDNEVTEVINSASVSANEPDLNLANNIEAETTAVKPQILFRDGFEQDE
jgi:uncharacterized repeat protein (TIGR01451 family)